MFEVTQWGLLSLDTEWKSDLINSRNFDKEIGHQNPRYSDSLEIMLLYFCFVESNFYWISAS